MKKIFFVFTLVIMCVLNTSSASSFTATTIITDEISGIIKFTTGKTTHDNKIKFQPFSNS